MPLHAAGWQPGRYFKGSATAESLFGYAAQTTMQLLQTKNGKKPSKPGAERSGGCPGTDETELVCHFCETNIVFKVLRFNIMIKALKVDGKLQFFVEALNELVTI